MKSNTHTIADIAELANVSKSTVSRVLNEKSVVNEKTRQIVLRAMESLEFQPNQFARSLASGKSMTVGVITQKIGSPYYDAIMQGIIDGCEQTPYSPIFVDGQWDQAAAVRGIQTLVGRQVDGLIIVGGAIDDSVIEALDLRVPMVVVGMDLSRYRQDCIFLDNKKAAFDATMHLIEMGHQHIAMVRGIKHHQDAIRRYEGFQAAMNEAGLTIDPELVVDGDFSAHAGNMAVNSLLMRGKLFSGLFCANDMIAFGARLALYRKQFRVPEDISIVGFDDQAESAVMTPPLTTMRQPATEMGVEAVRGLVERINGQPHDFPIFHADLVVRESVARCSQGGLASH